MFQEWPTNMFTNSRRLQQISIHVANNVCNVHLYSQKIAVRINTVKHEKKQNEKRSVMPNSSISKRWWQKMFPPDVFEDTLSFPQTVVPQHFGSHVPIALPIHLRKSPTPFAFPGTFQTPMTTHPKNYRSIQAPLGGKRCMHAIIWARLFSPAFLVGPNSAFLLSAHANSTKFLTEMRPESWSQGAAIWCEGRSSLKVWGFPFCLACFGFAFFFYKKAGPMKPRRHRQSSNQFRQSALPLPAHTMRHD